MTGRERRGYSDCVPGRKALDERDNEMVNEEWELGTLGTGSRFSFFSPSPSLSPSLSLPRLLTPASH